MLNRSSNLTDSQHRFLLNLLMGAAPLEPDDYMIGMKDLIDTGAIWYMPYGMFDEACMMVQENMFAGYDSGDA